jgi:hypothetical protein
MSDQTSSAGLAYFWMGSLLIYPQEVGQFRDCYLHRAEDKSLEIHVFTSNGGGHWFEPVTAALRKHPDYLRDDFNTLGSRFVTYAFRAPPHTMDLVPKLLRTMSEDLVFPNAIRDDVGAYYNRTGQRIGLLRWAKLREDYEGYRLIARDEVGKTTVITLWHGMDASLIDQRTPPLIFGTITKCDDDYGEEETWATEAEALAGHAARVERERAKR